MEKNSCTKEGLFITELTDEFFEKCMSENKELKLPTPHGVLNLEKSIL